MMKLDISEAKVDDLMKLSAQQGSVIYYFRIVKQRESMYDDQILVEVICTNDARHAKGKQFYLSVKDVYDTYLVDESTVELAERFMHPVVH